MRFLMGATRRPRVILGVLGSLLLAGVGVVILVRVVWPSVQKRRGAGLPWQLLGKR